MLFMHASYSRFSPFKLFVLSVLNSNSTNCHLSVDWHLNWYSILYSRCGCIHKTDASNFKILQSRQLQLRTRLMLRNYHHYHYYSIDSLFSYVSITASQTHRKHQTNKHTSIDFVCPAEILLNFRCSLSTCYFQDNVAFLPTSPYLADIRDFFSISCYCQSFHSARKKLNTKRISEWVTRVDLNVRDECKYSSNSRNIHSCIENTNITSGIDCYVNFPFEIFN